MCYLEAERKGSYLVTSGMAAKRLYFERSLVHFDNKKITLPLQKASAGFLTDYNSPNSLLHIFILCLLKNS